MRTQGGMVRKNSAQDLCNELFLQVEGLLSDAWISDDAYTDDPKEYLKFVRGSLYKATGESNAKRTIPRLRQSADFCGP